MIAVPVIRYARRKVMGDEQSPLIYLLKQKPGSAQMYTIDMLASEIETVGSLSVEDVTHVLKSFVRAMKKVLTAGNKVKVDGLGIFHTTFTCPGVDVEKECSVKNIKRVNIRFLTDNTLRLVNDNTAVTRGGANNVLFELVAPAAPAAGGGGGGEGGGDDPVIS